MPYTSLQKLIDRFGQSLLIALTDRAEVATGQIDETVVASALADTDALINGYLANKYRLPLTETHDLLEALARDIAIYKLHISHVDEKIEADYAAAIQSLKGLSSGAIRLTGESGAEPAGSGTSGARLTDRDRPMTEDNLRGFI